LLSKPKIVLARQLGNRCAINNLNRFDSVPLHTLDGSRPSPG
jgi:hypothetical protein